MTGNGGDEQAVQQATRLVCDRCGTTGDGPHDVQRTPHSLAEATERGNPPLCWKCNAEVSR